MKLLAVATGMTPTRSPALVAFRRQLPWRFVGLQVALTLMWVGLGSAAYAVLNGM